MSIRYRSQDEKFAYNSEEGSATRVAEMPQHIICDPNGPVQRFQRIILWSISLGYHPRNVAAKGEKNKTTKFER
jgi:hypothetical protein